MPSNDVIRPWRSSQQSVCQDSGRNVRRNFGQVDLSRSKWHVDLIELNPDHAGIVVVEVSGSDFQPVKLPWFQGEGMKFADRIRETQLG